MNTVKQSCPFRETSCPISARRKKRKNSMGGGQMSGTLLERLQQKMDAELEQYRSGLLSRARRRSGTTLTNS